MRAMVSKRQHAKMHFIWHLLGVCLAGLMFSGYAFAQNNAEITGTITDQSGRVVPNASVQVINTQTSIARKAESQSNGFYLVTTLPLGAYEVKVTAPGFKTSIRSGIHLSVGQSAEVDIQLSVGGVVSQVSVTAAAPQVNTRNATEETVMDQERMQEIPLSGRSPAALLSLLPGVSNVSDTGALPTSRRVWVNVAGGRTDANSCTLDGSQWINIQYSYCNPLPPPDMLSEFSVQTNSSDSSQGLASAANIAVVTKAGTNQFHGELWDYLRNNVLNAKDYFSAESPFLVQNQFGFAVGGPILKKRLFFFASYQGTRIRESDLFNTAVPPTAAERQGDFSNSPGAAPIDPSTGLPFPGGIIPKQDWDPAAVTALSKIVSANTPNGHWTSFLPDDQNANTYMLRVDYQLASSNHLFARYYRNDGGSEHSAGIAPSLANIPWSMEHDEVNFANWIVSDTHIFSPNLINQGFVSLSTNLINWVANDSIFSDAPAMGVNIPAPPVLPFPPALSVTGRFSARAPLQWICPKCSSQWDMADSVSWIKGRHSLTFGFSYLPTHYGPHQAGFNNGQFGFNGEYTGNALADFLLGKPSSFSFYIERFDMKSAFYGIFANDNFQIEPRLTLNLGIRYHYETPVTSIPGYGATFINGFQSTRFPNAPVGMAFYGDQTGLPKSFFYPDRNNFAPRLGIAWDVFGTGKTSIRAGYGIFFQQQQNGNSQYLGYDQPFVPNETLTSVPSFSNPLINFHAGVIPGNPLETYNPKTGEGVFNPPAVMYGIDPHFPNAYVQQYNLSFGQQLGGGFSAEVAYVGNVGHKLQTPNQINPEVYGPGATVANGEERRRFKNEDPDLSSITYYTNSGNSSYNAFEVIVKRRFSHSYLLDVNYTWSRSLDETSGFTGTTTFQNPYNPHGDWGLSDFHRASVFNASWVWQPTYLTEVHGLAGQVLHGWEASGVFKLASGLPFNVVSGRDNSLTAVGNDRPNVVGEPRLPGNRSQIQRIQQYFNTAAFVPNPAGTYGDSGRNSLIGPGYADIDLGAYKSFPIIRDQSLQFRAGIFNLFNHPNFTNPDSNLASITFGQLQGTNGQRVIQFALKYEF